MLPQCFILALFSCFSMTRFLDPWRTKWQNLMNPRRRAKMKMEKRSEKLIIYRLPYHFFSLMFPEEKSVKCTRMMVRLFQLLHQKQHMAQGLQRKEVRILFSILFLDSCVLIIYHIQTLHILLLIFLLIFKQTKALGVWQAIINVWAGWLCVSSYGKKSSVINNLSHGRN